MKKLLTLTMMLIAFASISKAQCAGPVVIDKNKVGNQSYAISYRVDKSTLTGAADRYVSFDNGATWQHPSGDPCSSCMVIYNNTANYFDFQLGFSQNIPIATTQNSYLVRIRMQCADGSWSAWSETVKVRIH